LRSDDNAEVLRQRLEAYRQQTAPLVAYYRKQNVLRTVNGMAPIADVAAAIDKALPAEPSAPKPKSVRNGAKRATVKARKPQTAARLGKKSSKRASNLRKTTATHKSAARKSKNGETARP
jgi:adenylate kinase